MSCTSASAASKAAQFVFAERVLCKDTGTEWLQSDGTEGTDSCPSAFYPPQRISPCINKHLITLHRFPFYAYLMACGNEIVLR